MQQEICNKILSLFWPHLNYVATQLLPCEIYKKWWNSEIFNTVTSTYLQGVIFTKVTHQNVKNSLRSVWPGADLGVQAVIPYRWPFKSSPAVGCLLPLLSARPAVTFPAEECHRPSTSTKLYYLVTEVHRCEQLAQGCYADDHGKTRTHDLNDRKSNALPLSHLR